MTPHRRRRILSGFVLVLLALLALVGCPSAAFADLMVVGNDEKVVFDAEGDRKFVAPGKDTISIVDITDREAPKILVSFPLSPAQLGARRAPPYVILFGGDAPGGGLPVDRLSGRDWTSPHRDVS